MKRFITFCELAKVPNVLAMQCMHAYFFTSSQYNFSIRKLNLIELSEYSTRDTGTAHQGDDFLSINSNGYGKLFSRLQDNLSFRESKLGEHRQPFTSYVLID